jgi:hypothetical protein
MLVTACAQPSADSAKEAPIDTFTGIHLNTLSDYQTTYDIEFKGDYTWHYSLITQYNGELMEYNLHIEGIDPVRNPGDIRLVSDGETSWMTGPGVEHECFMFPDDFEIGYTFLTPDDTFPPETIAPLLIYESEEQRRGLPVSVFSATVPEHEGWRNLNIVMWLAEGGDYPILYDIQTHGDDPIFDAGEGQFSGIFSVTDGSNYAIEPVTGCDITVPLPEDAAQVVRFPGLVSFETIVTPDNMAIFYQDFLTTNGWVADEPLKTTDTGMQMSYSRGEELLVFYFKVGEEGVTVEILQQ